MMDLSWIRRENDRYRTRLIVGTNGWNNPSEALLDLTEFVDGSLDIEQVLGHTERWGDESSLIVSVDDLS